MKYLTYLETGGWIGIIAGVAVAVAGITFAILFLLSKGKKNNASKNADQILKDAKIKADHIVKNAEIDAKQAAFEARQQAENDIRSRKGELAAEEQKLSLREQAIDQRDAALIEKENNLERKNESLNASIESFRKREAELNQKIDDIIHELEKVSGMSVQEAHDEIMARVESKMAMEIAAYIKNEEDEAKATAQAKAIDLLVLACQKYAQDVVTERTVSVVALPSDEMKGRIIGREGRNIRVLEQELGVDLVIDDTPEAITVSCFDPIRREIARRTLEILVKDGRIQPGRIEEVAAKCKAEIEALTQKYGEEAAFKLGLPRINRELLRYVGRLHFRTSYGQNALDHSMEVAYLAGLMAGSMISAKRSISKWKALTSNSAPSLPANIANPMSSSIRSNLTMAILKLALSSLTLSPLLIPCLLQGQERVRKRLKPMSNVSKPSRLWPNPSMASNKPSRCNRAAKSASLSCQIAFPMLKRSR